MKIREIRMYYGQYDVLLTQGVERWHCLDQGPHWWTDLVSMPQGKTIQRESKKIPLPEVI